MWKKKKRLLRSMSRSQGRFRISVNICSDDIFLNHRTFCYQIWYGDAASLASHAEFYVVVVAVFKVKVTEKVQNVS